MSRKITLALIIIAVIGGLPVFAQYEPHTIRNNPYFLESLRLTKLAQDTYDYGDYDASAQYAQEAIYYARLSDEYAALQLKIKETNDAITAAKQRLDWAVSSGAAGQFPNEYGEAMLYYNASLAARSAQQWDEAIIAAHKVMEILAYITPPVVAVLPEEKSSGEVNPLPEVFPLPSQYTVRTWSSFRDCLWNIAAYPWAYGDPYQWRLLYDANRSKMPEQGNPDLIEPGMVLDIPSIRGETRQGMWVPGRTYPR